MRSFILVGLYSGWFSCSLSVNAGLLVLCESLPLGLTVLLGHPRFQKDHVIVSGTEGARMSVSELHEIRFALGLQLSAFRSQAGSDGSVLIRSAAQS